MAITMTNQNKLISFVLKIVGIVVSFFVKKGAAPAQESKRPDAPQEPIETKQDRLSPHFKRAEFACKCGCGFDDVDLGLVSLLEMIRSEFNAPIAVNSGCRCETYNAEVGGATNSQHLYGKAADISIRGVSPSVVADFIDEVFPDQLGLGRYRTFTHVDNRNCKARWNG